MAGRDSMERRKTLGGASAATAVALVAAILVMVNYLAARHYARGDFTGRGVYSLSDKSVATLRALGSELAGPLEVTVMMSPGGLGQGGVADVQDPIKELLERMRRHCGRLRYEIVDVDRDKERAQILEKKYKFSEANFLEEREGVVVFAVGDRIKIVTSSDLADYDFAGDPQAGGQGRTLKAFKGEQAFLSAILTVTQKTQRTVCFSKGHEESLPDSFEDDGYAYLAEDLKRDNYKVEVIEGLERGGVPADKGCAVVVVAGPKRAFSQAEADALDAYAKGGGKLLLMLGPVLDRGLTGFQKVGLEALAERWGGRPGDSLVLDPKETVDFLTWASRSYGEHPITRGMEERPTTWPMTRQVSATPRDGLEVKELVRTSDAGWGETSLSALRGEAELGFDPATDAKGPVAVAVAAEEQGGKRARVVVIGSSAVGMNRRFPRGLLVRDYNRDLFLSTIAWLSNQEQLVAIGPKTPEHVKLALTEGQLSGILGMVLGLLPLCGAVVGFGVWWRRRS